MGFKHEQSCSQCGKRTGRESVSFQEPNIQTWSVIHLARSTLCQHMTDSQAYAADPCQEQREPAWARSEVIVEFHEVCSVPSRQW
jgi:hypothetical protein